MDAKRHITDFEAGKGQWIATGNSRNSLPFLFKELGYTEGVEIGTQRGHFAYRLCKDNPSLHLTCVDPWSSSHGSGGQDRHDRFYAVTLERMKDYNCTIKRLTSMEAVIHVPDDSIDFVYIDGNHTFDYVVMDIIRWSAKVKSGGIVACHDYGQWHGCGVMHAVDSYTFCHGIYPKYLTLEVMPTAFWVKK